MPIFKDYMPGGSTIVNSADQTVSEIDPISNSYTSITEEHRRIHKGNMFSNIHRQTVTATGTHNVVGLTPASGYIHFRNANIGVQIGGVIIDFYEDSSPPVGGTSLPSYNRNRNSTAVATIQVTHGGTVSALGTLLARAVAGGDQTAKDTNTSGSVSEPTEWVLKQNMYYTLSVTNSSANNTIDFSFIWYESGVN